MRETGYTAIVARHDRVLRLNDQCFLGGLSVGSVDCVGGLCGTGVIGPGAGPTSERVPDVLVMPVPVVALVSVLIVDDVVVMPVSVSVVPVVSVAVLLVFVSFLQPKRTSNARRKRASLMIVVSPE
jgi:hypothetical protein